jgi:hypothetical protein
MHLIGKIGMIPFQSKGRAMHYVYVDSTEYYRFHNPDTTFVPMSTEGIDALRFIKLADALHYKQENQANFTFIDDDDDRVAAYWKFNDQMEQWAEERADRNRKIVEALSE